MTFRCTRDNGTMADQTPRAYTERLWPSVIFFIALLLIIPALTVLLTPYSLQAGLIAGVIAYALVCAIFLLSSRRVSVDNGTLTAGGVAIDVNLLGDVTTLDSQALNIAIGRRLDARAYLCVSGWIHTGIRVEVTDPDDSTPYWIITTRNPQTLAASIRDQQTSRV